MTRDATTHSHHVTNAVNHVLTNGRQKATKSHCFLLLLCHKSDKCSRAKCTDILPSLMSTASSAWSTVTVVEADGKNQFLCMMTCHQTALTPPLPLKKFSHFLFPLFCTNHPSPPLTCRHQAVVIDYHHQGYLSRPLSGRDPLSFCLSGSGPFSWFYTQTLMNT